jgi:sugar/nucleoside kinase (ribokinase family)
MSKESSVLTIGPSLVDFEFNLTEKKQQYDNITKYLNVSPGEWKLIPQEEELKDIIEILIGQKLPTELDKILALQKDNCFELTAGSTNLGVLAALNKKQRVNSTFVSTIGTDGKSIDPLSSFFSNSLKKYGINHQKSVICGRNPTGIVLSMNNQTDKILLTHPGVSYNLDLPSIKSTDFEVLHVEAYELREGKIAETIDNLINEAGIKVSIGLGNYKIIDVKLKSKILNYIEQGKVDILLANEQEIIKLLGLEKESISVDEISQLYLRYKIPHIMITLGERGITAFNNTKFAYSKAQEVDNIKNTSGAGDTAAGVFISGIIDNQELPQILKDATYYAARVLEVYGNKLPNGR